MDDRIVGGQPLLVGRERERAVLRSVVDRAVSGEPGLVLVHGEAGIGKTSLVREVAQSAETEGAHLLLGLCLRFGSDVTSYVPFTQALTHWLRTSTSDLPQKLSPVGRLDDLIPALSDRPRGVALLQIGAVLESLQTDRPTVLVVDDLQWADPSSLDVLSYLVAGFAPGQRLAILATYRDTDLDDGHRLHGWLADADRLPSVSRLPLGRLDAWSVEEMVLSRGGTDADAGMAQEILRRSGGNPYLADLLIDDSRAKGPGGTSSGGRLADALLASWHRLSSPGRKVTQLLAVAGAPVAFAVLRELSARHAVDSEGTAEAVNEASVQGITLTTESGAIWFRHPLLAETIAGSLNEWEAAGLHAELAAAWEAAVAVQERDRANSLALHYDAAHDHDRAFHWSVRAADEAQLVLAWEEVASHLSVAVSLLPEVSEEVAGSVDELNLLLRAARACDSAGDDRGAMRHYEAALARVDRSQHPLQASRILLDLHFVRGLAVLGSNLGSLDIPREVLALTAGNPHAPERSIAFAHLAFAELVNGVAAAGEHAQMAVQLAETTDSPAAMVWALGTRAQVRKAEGIADAERALALATELGDPQLMSRSAILLANTYQWAGRYADAAEMGERVYAALLDAGQFDYAAWADGNAAWWNFALGRWDHLRLMVRELLTIARGAQSAGMTRCVAALITAHEGNADAAALHLRRAEELMPTWPGGDVLGWTQIQVSIAMRDPLRALELIDRYMAEEAQIDPASADELLQLASRAATQLIELDPGTDGRRSALTHLERIEAARGTDPPPFASGATPDAVRHAFSALHSAQRAQCEEVQTGVAELWEAACTATEEAGLQYEHARALFCLARHLLTHRLDRSRATTALATARRMAIHLGASPLAGDITILAEQAHVDLLVPDPGESAMVRSTPVLPASPPLTVREREVLDGLLSGETYAQIAARLFISAKTVSSHASSVLRKTGTSSRIELADLAHRHRQGDSD
ncbi:helix-turn-helix transcriptional regulator [Knoellia sp. LjRoot47]|uniref:helix-turn-helix transcriptional regulator n=1 Tax=Knoellia sp. LjRoot47 TaxID=3342330 RepID=UPI003ED14095